MKEFQRTYYESVPLAEIDPGDRFREDYGDLNALSESFDIAGVIHPLSLRKHATSTIFKYELIAGGRRYFALIINGVKTAPAYVYDSVDDEELRMLEKIENAQRKDIDWKEAAKLDAEIHRLQMERHGASPNNAAPEDGQWNQEKTAEFLGKSKGYVSDSLKLARALEEHPEIAQCTKVSQAKNYLRSMERSEKAKRLAESALQKEKSSSRVQVLAPCYIVGDAIEGLRGTPDGIADLLEIDPPYGIGYNERNTSRANTVEYKEVAAAEYKDFITAVITESYRVAKPNSWCLLWADVQKLETITKILQDAGFKPCPIPLIWNKAIGGTLSNPNLRLAHTYEVCIYAHKGTPKIVGTGHIDVFSYLSIRDQYRIHPTERPIDLMVDLFKTFAEPGSQIISPFLGSGVSIYAAHEVSMGCYGWDLDESNKAKFVVKCENWRGFNRKELEEDGKEVLSTEGPQS